MDKFCLGIIGRCLACQPWMPSSDLYHRQLKVLLQERDGITLRVSIAGRSDLEPYERMRVLHAKKPLNGVLYHMRHTPEHLLFYKRQDSSGKLRYSLHPYFFKRFLAKQQPVYKEFNAVGFALAMRRNKDSQNIFNIPPPIDSSSRPRKFLGIPLHQVNLWAGKLCGLKTHAISNEWDFFERLRSLCLELNIPLFVLGPIPLFDMLGSKKKSHFWEQKCRFAEIKLSKYDVPHYFLRSMPDEKNMPFYTNDQAHLTADGHAFLAKELYPEISLWIKSIKNNQNHPCAITLLRNIRLRNKRKKLRNK